MDQHDAILARLLDLHPKKIDLSLGRIERLLVALGRPDMRLPRPRYSILSLMIVVVFAAVALAFYAAQRDRRELPRPRRAQRD